MYRLGFVPSYFLWHYSIAIGEIVSIFRNFIWGEKHLFSIKILLKSLFSPWHRLDEKYSKSFDIGEYLSVIIVNLLMRALGMIMRFFVITIGLFIMFLTLIFGVIFLFIWMIMPVFIISLFIHGIATMI